MGEKKYEILADWLDDEAMQIRSLEERAFAALYDENDEPAYRNLMQAKALRLTVLAENGAPLVFGTDRQYEKKILSRMEQFSMSASRSLEVGSVFYMAALLYPEGYVEGEKNDLEVFAAKVRSLG